MSTQRENLCPRSNRISSINTYLPQLVEYLDVVNLATYLLTEELITHDERRELLELRTKHHQIPELMRLLQTKGSDWYTRFRSALTMATQGSDMHLGHKNLVEDILPESLETRPQPRESASQQEISLERELVSTGSAGNCKCYPLLKRLLLQRQLCVDCCCQGNSHAPSGICSYQMTSGACAGDAGYKMAVHEKSDYLYSAYAKNNLDVEDGIPTETSSNSGLSLEDRACREYFGTTDGEDSVTKTVEPCELAECWKVWKEAECGMKKQFQGLQMGKELLGRLRREIEKQESVNESQQSEIERQRSEIEELKKQLKCAEESKQKMELERARREEEMELERARREEEMELELQRARRDEEMEQFAGQHVLQSAKLEDVQSLKSLPGEQAAKLMCRRQKGPLLRHLKLLVLGDFGGTPHESRARMAQCAHTVDAILGHSQDIWQQDGSDHEVGVVRMQRREKLHASCSVRVTTVTADLSDSTSLPSSFSPDLTLLCLGDSGAKLQGSRESLQRLTAHFSPTVWEHCVVAFHPGGWNQDSLTLKEELLEALNRVGVGAHVSGKIPFAITPNPTNAHPYWLNHCITELYTACVERALPSARTSLIQLNKLRLRPSKTVDYATLSSTLTQQPLPLTHCRMGRLQKAMAGEPRHQCCLKMTACKLTAPLVGRLCRREGK